MKKLKKTFHRINDKYLFGRYNHDFHYMNQVANKKEYTTKCIFLFVLIFSISYLLFNNLILTFVIALILTIFFINEILLNEKKLNYESYILSQLTIYTSQMALLVSYNNIYASLKEVVQYLDYPIKADLEDVIKKIDSGLSITKAFEEFNYKYNNRTITLFNQTLELFDQHGNSDAEVVLQIVSEEMNMLKVKKDKYFKFKKEWRLNFYVVAILSMTMPLILRLMIPEIYLDFMNSFGSVILTIVCIINILVIKKVELIYRNQNIGEGGY